LRRLKAPAGEQRDGGRAAPRRAASASSTLKKRVTLTRKENRLVRNLTKEELLTQLREILEKWPLYREFTYLGADTAWVLPPHISLHCPTCKKDQWWQRAETNVNDKAGYGAAKYVCRNCDYEECRFYFYWHGKQDTGYRFMKVGQYPPLEERIPTELEQQMKGDDLEFYKRALRCRNFNFGLAALAYLRRVVENRMNDLLDLIADAARKASYEAEHLKRLESVKASRVFDDKVSYAALILPPSLKPGGANPIDLLHDLASEGIHHLSDANCIDVFDQSRAVFEHVFIELKVSEAKDKSFLEGLSQLQKRKSKPAAAAPAQSKEK
jgi:hypothetical protein